MANDLAGRRLATVVHGDYPAGRHEIRWNGRDAAGQPAPSGAYVFKVTAGAESRVVKGVLLK